MLPSLFISHGSPALMLMNNKTTDFLKELPKSFQKPKYILVVSAHWLTRELRILTNEEPFEIYDFYNFPQGLYEKQYPANNDIKKVKEVVELLKKSNIAVFEEETRSGYDHGVWSPLSLMYPDADIPVIQLSLPIGFSPDELVEIGVALQSLREDTLIIGSGAMTHNLRGSSWIEYDENIALYAKEFRNWIVEKLENSGVNSLVNYMKEAPNALQNHPTEEHFLPLFVSLGASKDKKGKSLHDVYMYGNQSMDTIIFEN